MRRVRGGVGARRGEAASCPRLGILVDATVAAGMLVENAAMFLFGKDPPGMASALGRHPVMLFGVGVLPLHIVILLVGLGLTGVFLWATRATPIANPCSPWCGTR